MTMTMNPTHSVHLTSASIFVCQGETYVPMRLRKNPSEVCCGCWELPGGFVKESERTYQAEMRILRETFLINLLAGSKGFSEIGANSRDCEMTSLYVLRCLHIPSLPKLPNLKSRPASGWILPELGWTKVSGNQAWKAAGRNAFDHTQLIEKAIAFADTTKHLIQHEGTI